MFYIDPYIFLTDIRILIEMSDIMQCDSKI